MGYCKKNMGFAVKGISTHSPAGANPLEMECEKSYKHLPCIPVYTPGSCDICRPQLEAMQPQRRLQWVSMGAPSPRAS